MSIQNFAKTNNQLQHSHFFHKQSKLQWLYDQKIPTASTAKERKFNLKKHIDQIVLKPTP